MSSSHVGDFHGAYFSSFFMHKTVQSELDSSDDEVTEDVPLVRALGSGSGRLQQTTGQC